MRSKLLTFGVILAMLGAGLIVLSASASDKQAAVGDATTTSFLRWISTTRDAFALFGEFWVDLVNAAWQSLPPDLHCLMGLVFFGSNLLTLIGVISLWSGFALWRRHLS